MQIGVSSFLWRQQHVVGHHTHTNLDSDPDIRASAQDVRRVAPHHQHHWYHVSVLKGLPSAAIGSFKTQMQGPPSFVSFCIARFQLSSQVRTG